MRAARRAWITGDADLTQGRTLEIGPLANPVVGPEVADVRYVDVLDRAGLIEHYRGNPAVDPDAIPEVHFWITRDDGTVSTLAEAVAADGPYQHVVASHVIEHVPDLIGWLRDVAEVLVDDGALILAVPDRRFCFDARRAPTTVGQVVQAHLDGDTIPSARAVLDHFLDAVSYDAEQAWRGEGPPSKGSHPLAQVRQHLARQRAGDYVDCHVWPMTPRGLADLVARLHHLELVDFGVERITATQVGHQEFYATLRRLPRTGDVEAHRRRALEELAAVTAALPDETPGGGHPAGESGWVARQAHLEEALATERERLVRARKARDTARRRLERARAGADPRPGAAGASHVGLLGRVARRLRRV